MPDPVSRTRTRWMRGAILLLGLMVGQAVLYAPSLSGQKVLLPLDLLVDPGSQGGGTQTTRPHDRLLADPINQIEPMRRFAVSEVRSGRMPLWGPNNYCGAPFLAANQGGVFSPCRILDYLWPDPWALAWGQMLKALVCGVGAYMFFRRAMKVRWEAALIGAWIWPHSGYLVLWTMWPLSAAASWLPWVLLGVNRCIRRPGAKPLIGLAIATAFAIVSGHSATGAHVLVGSGLYGAWLLIRSALSRASGSRLAWAAVSVAAGWVVGLCLAAPQLLPTLEYMRTSLRMANRLQSGAEIPPVGLSALPQVVLPWIHGSTRSGLIYIGADNPLESAIAGYAGAITVLTLAPFGFVPRRRRMEQLFWLALAFIAAAYVLDLPGGWWLSRLPVFQSLRGNRFIFISGFAVVAMAVAGLDAILRGAKPKRWLLIFASLPLVLAGWCIWRSTQMADVVALHAVDALRAAQSGGVAIFQGMVDVTMLMIDRFQTLHYLYAGISLLATALLVILWRFPRPRVAMAIGALAAGEVIASAWNFNPQKDRSLYEWKLPAFEAIAQAEPGRICGVLCLPPMVNRWGGVQDVRGYDAADPMRYVQVLLQLAAPGSPTPDPSAATFALLPRYPSPLADFLSLRYLIIPGVPADPSKARFVTPGFYVIENPTVLPRVTVPGRSMVITNDDERLKTLGSPDFDPRQTVLLEKAAGSSNVQGTARIVGETPSRVEIEYAMQSPGVVVLADTWDAGWRATVNGQPAEVLRANHAFRAVEAPAGNGRIIFTYWPRSFMVGLVLAGAGVAGCFLILSISAVRRHRMKQ